MRRPWRAPGCGIPSSARGGLSSPGLVGHGVVFTRSRQDAATDHWVVPVEALTLIVAGVDSGWSW